MDVETSIQKKKKTAAWFSAMRLRTLPLALASTLTGAFLTLEQGAINGWVLLLTALTTIFLQVNSNLANDYGDFSHGTDNEGRVGPQRAMQSGAITEPEIRKAIILASSLSLISGVVLLLISSLEWGMRGVLFLFGIAAIYASIKYTAGKNPYGYRGLGDVSVMAFFGVLGVVGSYLCQTGTLDTSVFLAAISIGAFSTGVLNINNTRDLDNDEKSGKITLAVKLGPKKARMYHLALIAIGCGSFLVYAAMHFEWGWAWLFLLSYPLFILNAVKVFTTTESVELDSYLKQLAISTFLFSIILGAGLLLQ